MKRTLPVLLAFLLFSSVAEARPGFYLGLGFGASSANGESVPYDAFDQPGRFTLGGGTFSTELDGGLATQFRLGFNIEGYAALEAMVQGHAKNLTDESRRNWAAHWHLGPRIYPLWHWRHELPEKLQRLEPSIFLGWGGSWQVYNPTGNSELGWSGLGTFRFGLGLEYFVLSYMKLGLDYYHVSAPYDTFIFNFSDGISGGVDSERVGASFNQVMLTMNFHFGVEDKPIAY